MSVAVVRLGVGNTASVMFAMERLGAKASLTSDAHEIADAERVILPGVGAAAHAMARAEAMGLMQILRDFRRPLLGICLGQQLLYERSEEGDAEGLGLLPGAVTRLLSRPDLPLPNMGWCALSKTRDHALLDGVKDQAYAYFVHSYACPIGAETVATAQHAAPFSAIVASGNVYGCQFHPERSGAAGARILANFLTLPC